MGVIFSGLAGLGAVRQTPLSYVCQDSSRETGPTEDDRSAQCPLPRGHAMTQNRARVWAGKFLARMSSAALAMVTLFAVVLAIAFAPGPQNRTTNGTATGPTNPLVIGIQLEPPNLDPTAGAAEAIDAVVLNNIFEGLVRLTRGGAIAPGLATDWAFNADHTGLTMTLREHVRFHDGHVFDAADVVFTFDRARGPASRNAQQTRLRRITDVRALGPHKIAFTFDRPFPQFLTMLTWGDCVIVHAGSADTNAAQPIGTGPFRFARWQRSTRIDLVRYEDYWGPAPALGAASFRFIPDPSVAQTALRAGDIDVFAGYPAPENMAQFAARADFNIMVGTSQGETILALNHRRPALSDKRVRQALSHIIDRQAVLDGTLFGYGALIYSHYPPGGDAHIDLSSAYPKDHDRARTLLAQAGYGDGLTLSLKLPPTSYARRSGEIIAAQLRAFGLGVTVENIEWAQWIDQVFLRQDFDLTIVAHTEPDDIDIYGRPDYYFGYDDAAVQSLVTELGTAAFPRQRMNILRKIQTRITQDAVNVYLFQLPSLTVCRTGLSGFWRDAPLASISLRDVTMGDTPRTEQGAC